MSKGGGGSGKGGAGRGSGKAGRGGSSQTGGGGAVNTNAVGNNATTTAPKQSSLEKAFAESKNVGEVLDMRQLSMLAKEKGITPDDKRSKQSYIDALKKVIKPATKELSAEDKALNKFLGDKEKARVSSQNKRDAKKAEKKAAKASASAATVSRGAQLRAKYGSVEKGIGARFADDSRRANYRMGPTPLEGRIQGGAGRRQAAKATDEFRKAGAIKRGEEAAVQKALDRRARKTGKDIAKEVKIGANKTSTSEGFYSKTLSGSAARGGTQKPTVSTRKRNKKK